MNTRDALIRDIDSILNQTKKIIIDGMSRNMVECALHQAVKNGDIQRHGSRPLYRVRK